MSNYTLSVEQKQMVNSEVASGDERRAVLIALSRDLYRLGQKLQLTPLQLSKTLGITEKTMSALLKAQLPDDQTSMQILLDLRSKVISL